MRPWADTSATMSQNNLSCLKINQSINRMSQLYHSWVFTRRDKSTQRTDISPSVLTVSCSRQLRNGASLAVCQQRLGRGNSEYAYSHTKS